MKARPWPFKLLLFSSLFVLSGFSALLYQVIWQRLLTTLFGTNVASVTIVVVAFMAGLGLGNLFGGYIADKFSLRNTIRSFVVAELGIATCGLISIWYITELLPEISASFGSSLLVTGLLSFFSLLIPTFLMGVSLPLLSRYLTKELTIASTTIGALYSSNTFGSALGALATLYIARFIGFEKTVSLGVALNTICALGAFVLFKIEHRVKNDVPAPGARMDAGAQKSLSMLKPSLPESIWIFIYGFSGFVALSLEIVWFRILEILHKSNAYTFSHLLFIFLAGIAVGGFWGTRAAGRVRNPAQLFLLLQMSIPLYSGLIFFVLFSGGVDHGLWFIASRYLQDTFVNLEIVPATAKFLLLPVVLFGVPTLIMGYSFPLLQSIVQTDSALLGRRVGWALTANICGSVIGPLLVGLLLLDVIGAADTLRILTTCALVFAFLYVYLGIREKSVNTALRSGLVATALVLTSVLVIPDSKSLIAALHETKVSRVLYGEDSTGVTLAKLPKDSSNPEDKTWIFINGKSHSWVPFCCLHTVLGVFPAALHPNPERIAVIGIGSGDTTFAVGARFETREVVSIEIVRPLLPTLRELNERQNYPGLSKLFNDPRFTFLNTDGRKYLRESDDRFDIIEADALRPGSAFAGNLYSEEYFELIKSRLRKGGFAVSWAPTQRTADTFIKVFPYVLYGGDVLVGSAQPITLNPELILKRLQDPHVLKHFAGTGVEIDQLIGDFLQNDFKEYTPGPNRLWLTDTNTDLFPKDELRVQHSILLHWLGLCGVH